jgi:hypothetical protein
VVGHDEDGKKPCPEGYEMCPRCSFLQSTIGDF